MADVLKKLKQSILEFDDDAAAKPITLFRSPFLLTRWK